MSAKTITFDGVEVLLFTGHDGKLVIQIDTGDSKHIADNGQPVVRVNMNDARLWEGFNDGDESYGDQYP